MHDLPATGNEAVMTRARHQSPLRFHASRIAASFALASVVSLAGAEADAQSAAPPSHDAGEGRSAVPRSSLAVQIEVAAGTVNPDAVRVGIAAELGINVSAEAVRPGASGLLVRVDTQRVAELEFRSPSGKSVRRRVELPKDHARAVETIALLSGNLVRDEAGELLARLQRSQAPNGVDEEAPEPTPSAPEAAPNGSPAGAVAAAASPREGATATGKAAAPAASKTEPKRPSGAAPSPEPESEAQDSEPPLEDTFFDASLFHPVSVHPDSERRRIGLELGLVYSRVGALDGFGFTLFAASVDHSMQGVQIAGLASYTGGRTRGVSLAGVGTLSVGSLQGVEGAGFANLRLGRVGPNRELSFREGARVEGVQLAGGWNHVAGRVEGAQLGTVNTTFGFLRGAQLGVVNYARSLEGAEIGLVNVSGDSNAFQLGLVNVAGRFRGLELGLVNVSKHMDGVPIGLVSWAGNTKVSAVAFATTRYPANAGVKLVTGYVVNEYSVGVDPSDPMDASNGQAAVSIGAHIPLGELFLEPTVGYGYERRLDDRSTDGGVNAVLYRAKVGWQLTQGFGVFAGGGLVQTIPESTGRSKLEGGEALAGLQLF